MYDDETPLETALRRAATDPVFTPEFCGELLEAEVYVLGGSDIPRDGGFTAEEDTHVNLEFTRDNEGRSFLPFFTSLEALRRYIDGERPYLRLAARALFEMVRGSDLVLNPFSDYGKEITAEEVERLLETGAPTEAERTTVEKETTMLIGQPAVYPQELVETLSRFFETDDRVQAAYLALVHSPAFGDDPSLVVGIDCEAQSYDELSRASGTVAARMIAAGQSVAFCHVDTRGPEGIADHLVREVRPFYRYRPLLPASHPPIGGNVRVQPTFGKRNVH